MFVLPIIKGILVQDFPLFHLLKGNTGNLERYRF